MSSELSPEERELLFTRGAELLKQAGLVGELRIERLSGGRNNRVYRVAAGDQTVVLKWYFRHVQDQRDRLHAEFSFCEYALACGVACVARPLGRDDASQLAVYSLLDGQRLAAGEVGPGHIEQAIGFLRILNERLGKQDAKRLPTASEACFSLQEHIDCVSSRVARLQNITSQTDNHRDALELVNSRIEPALSHAIRRLQEWARQSNVSLLGSLTEEQRCVSPSDFGFHNALKSSDGQLSFVDFEYAGWDDPAKLLCDFYCQVEVPAPPDTWQQFADLTAAFAGGTEVERRRQALLFPLYQVKWCCILLNEFVATAGDRRKFSAQQPADLTLQLAKAQRMADQLPEGSL